MHTSRLEQTDFLIVGQGLAGTLLCHFLLHENQRVKLIDYPYPSNSSKVAAGVINPVTGRRIAKSWRYEEFFPFAQDTYSGLENLLGIKLWQERNVLRALHNNFEENEWLRRSAFPDYQAYLKEEADLRGLEGKVEEVYAWGELSMSAQVNMPELIRAFRQKLQEEGLLLEEYFDYGAVVLEKDRVVYKNLAARKLVFCEGAKAVENPFFNYLPFSVTKGELLLVAIPEARFEKMLKHHLFIVPLQGDLYWAGSTSRFEFEDEFPSSPMRLWLEGELRKTLKIPFEIKEHLAGIRPTVFDIRPFLGIHPQHPALAIFNGLGTKGASLGPFFASQMCRFLLGKSTLDPEVNIERFGDRYPTD